MSKKIIHLSDTHFGNPSETYNREKIKKSIIQNIKEIEGEKIIIISGDITFKANQEGYKEAKIFFSEIIDECQIKKDHIIACPGNHDINLSQSEDRPFKNFDSFIYALRRDNLCTASDKNESLIELDDTVILAANSAHHLDYTFGLINDSTIKLIEESPTLKDQRTKIFVTHHHLIGIHNRDTSTTRNALAILHALDNLKFSYILHGHQHSNTQITIGQSNIKIESARSLNFHDKGYHNGLNVIDLDSMTTKNLIISPDITPNTLTLKELK